MRHRSILTVPCMLALSVAGVARLSLAADAPATQPYAFHETPVLGTSLDLQVTAGTKADADKAHAAVLAEIERLRKILSTYDAASDLGKINATKDPVKVSPEVLEVLKAYDDWRGKSRGAFSGRLGSLIAVWKDAAKTGKMPEKSAVAMLASAEKNPLWKLDETAGTVQRLGDQLINIDSLGKGFVVSHAVAVGQAVARVKGMLLNIGGDITAAGSSSATGLEDWVVGIADPAHPAENAVPLTTAKITGMSIATSGSYERNYDVGGTKFSHILDPRNGYPIDSADAPTGKHNPLVVSATVIAKDNAAANALATSLCVLKPDEGLALIATIPGAEALIVTSEGKQLRSPGFARYETTNVAGKQWAQGFEVSVTFTQVATTRTRAYMAFWIEDKDGKHVRTIEEWGPGRWRNQFPTWWKAMGGNQQLVQSVSRATRQPGKYTLAWDGKDQAGNVVPAGTYKVYIEAMYQRDGTSKSSVTIECGDKKAEAKMPDTQHFNTVTVTFAPKGN
jgi:FAD:protein FMN transferase